MLYIFKKSGLKSFESECHFAIRNCWDFQLGDQFQQLHFDAVSKKKSSGLGCRPQEHQFQNFAPS